MCSNCKFPKKTFILLVLLRERWYVHMLYDVALRKLNVHLIVCQVNRTTQRCDKRRVPHTKFTKVGNGDFKIVFF